MASLLGKSTATPEDLVLEAGALAPLVLMKVGAQGCLVNQQGKIFHLPVEKVKVVDTIGAGDFFAAGFLYGFIKGVSVKEAARLANAFATEVVQVEGCSIHKIDPALVLRNGLKPVQEPN
jgi:sugar/nucleoside kinase (ribokinase family)